MLSFTLIHEIIATWIRRATLGMDGESGRLIRPSSQPAPARGAPHYIIPHCPRGQTTVDFRG